PAKPRTKKAARPIASFKIRNVSSLCAAGRASSPVENHLARLAGPHRVEALLEVGGGEAMRQDRREIEARLKERAHLVPGLEHAPAVDAFDFETLKDDLVPVDPGAVGHDAEHRDLAAVIDR